MDGIRIFFTKSKLRENFNDGCAKDKSKLQLCNCMFDGIFDRLGMQGFADMAAQYDEDGIMPSWTGNVLVNCMNNN